MVGAWERPDIAFEVWQELDQDLIGSLRDEVALGHFQLIAGQRACAGQKLISRSSRQTQQIALVPLALDRITRFVRQTVHALHPRVMNPATRGASTVQ